VEQSELIARRYRIGPEEALAVLTEAAGASPKLLERARTVSAPAQLGRLAEYRRVVDDSRSRVYHQLRRYVGDRSDLSRLAVELEAASAGRQSTDVERLRRAILQSHSSTLEREPHYPLFYRELFAAVGPARSVLDLGSGVHPLSFPFHAAGRQTTLYVAVDRDPAATAAVRAFAEQARPCRLVAIQRDLSEGWWEAVAEESRDFDLVLMLKLVPVLARQERRVVAGIAGTPGRTLVVTGSVEALTRRVSVRGREEASLRRFVAMAERPVVSRLELPSEVGYVLGERS
jgi:hypothetical protein